MKFIRANGEPGSFQFFFSINSNQQFYSWNFCYGWNCRLAYHVPRKKKTDTDIDRHKRQPLTHQVFGHVCVNSGLLH